MKPSTLLCQKNINLPNGSTTYCMRPANHAEYDSKGKCAIEPTEIDICCHSWRCPTGKPPYDAGTLITGGHFTQGPKDGADLGIGAMEWRKIPRDRPCTRSQVTLDK